MQTRTNHNLLKGNYSFPSGHIISIEDAQVMYSQLVWVTIPCLFQANKYPFGIYDCSFIINFKKSRDTEFARLTTDRGLLEYQGKKDLDSFFLSYISLKPLQDERTVMITLGLKGQYITMVINYYIPSLLILLICFATLLIPTESFNERIMVSLTALLVMASLFNQAYSATIHTPYLKLFDVWFVALILFGFLVVVFHVCVNLLLVSNKPLIVVSPLGDKIMEKTSRRADTWNSRGMKSLTVLFLSFMLLYLMFIFI